jgi:hypothetical protein
MKSEKGRLGVAIAWMLISYATPAFGQGVFIHHSGEACTQNLVQAVGLTAAQQSALEDLRRQTADSIGQILDQIIAIHRQIDTALASASPDPCAIGSLQIQENEHQNQIQKIQKNAEATFVASLSTDQQSKYASFIAANHQCAAFPSRLPRFETGPPLGGGPGSPGGKA